MKPGQFLIYSTTVLYDTSVYYLCFNHYEEQLMV